MLYCRIQEPKRYRDTISPSLPLLPAHPQQTSLNQEVPRCPRLTTSQLPVSKKRESILQLLKQVLRWVSLYQVQPCPVSRTSHWPELFMGLPWPGSWAHFWSQQWGAVTRMSGNYCWSGKNTLGYTLFRYHSFIHFCRDELRTCFVLETRDKILDNFCLSFMIQLKSQQFYDEFPSLTPPQQNKVFPPDAPAFLSKYLP